VKLPAFVTRVPRVWAITVGVLLVLYSLAGFLLAPTLVRNAILGGARQGLTRVPTIERVRVNPWALSLSLKGIALRDSTGDTLAACRSFYVRFNPLSPFFGAWTFAALHVDGPGASVEILADSTVNLARLLRAPADTTQPSQGLPAVLIQDLRIEDGWLRFANFTRAPAFRHRFHPVRLSMPCAPISMLQSVVPPLPSEAMTSSQQCGFSHLKTFTTPASVTSLSRSNIAKE